jgi:hypothetical protein
MIASFATISSDVESVPRIMILSGKYLNNKTNYSFGFAKIYDTNVSRLNLKKKKNFNQINEWLIFYFKVLVLDIHSAIHSLINFDSRSISYQK